MVYRQIDARVKTLVGGLGVASPVLATYAQAFSVAMPRHLQRVPETALKAIWKGPAYDHREAPIVLFGDFHARLGPLWGLDFILSGLQRSGKWPIVLALECFEPQARPLLEAFAHGRLDGHALSQSPAFRRWGFPSESYARLFCAAAAGAVPLVGINGGRGHGPWQRDRAMANELLSTRERFPGAAILAIVGEHHLANEHLPAHLRASFAGKEANIWRIFSNLDFYTEAFAQSRARECYRIVAAGPEPLPGGLYQLAPKTYCHLSEPSWYRWLTYYLWTECGAHVHLLEPEVSDYFSDLVSEINSHLTLGCSRSCLSKFRIKIVPHGSQARLDFVSGEMTWPLFDWQAFVLLAAKFVAQKARQRQAEKRIFLKVRSLCNPFNARASARNLPLRG